MSKIYQVRILDFSLSHIVKEWCVITFTFLLIIIIIVTLCYCSHLGQYWMIDFLISWVGRVKIKEVSTLLRDLISG